ncbi:MAG: ATP-dependent 6-phosphofructokinase [Candidatus Sumerlaeia bacterium]|nr:ATP-dependent 6-phosphofructokinase [Candidatus Sumerlaeia bacterium]
MRGVVYKAFEYGYEVIGIKRGWIGLLNPPETNVLTIQDVVNIHLQGGTILKTSRIDPYNFCDVNNSRTDRHKEIINNLEQLKCEALITVGGIDTLGVACKLWKEGVNIIGVPKTIDNDLSATDYTFGFDTAINIATEAIDRLHTTAAAHERVIVVELMGRYAGWITLYAGLAGGAHLILIPEDPFNIEEVCEKIQQIKNSKGYAIVAIAEGAVPRQGSSFTVRNDKLDAFGHPLLGGVSEVLAKEIEKQTKFETRNVILGHLQRGGAPTPFDRILGIRFGLKAVEMVKDQQFGKMASLCSTNIVSVPLTEVVNKIKTVPLELYDELKIFFR